MFLSRDPTRYGAPRTNAAQQPVIVSDRLAGSRTTQIRRSLSAFRFPLSTFYLRSFPYLESFTPIGAIGTLNGTVSKLSGSFVHSSRLAHQRAGCFFRDKMSPPSDGIPLPPASIPFHPKHPQFGVGLSVPLFSVHLW